MTRASGKIIYRSHWHNHLVEIIENGDDRSLYFAGNVLQSTMSISSPQRLVLSYTRYMMASLLFCNPPKNVLLVGVGAGSLIRFLFHHFPRCTIDGVDFSSRILDLARGYFNLPEANNINLHCQDGYEFITSQPQNSYDLILIDAFDQEGMAQTVYCQDFFAQCLFHLDHGGIVSLNLWSGDRTKMDKVRRDLENTFGSCLILPVPERGNIICIAARDPGLKEIMEQDYTELARMGAEFEINFREIFKVFIRQNLSFRQRIARFFN